jgi:hypothetical protein
MPGEEPEVLVTIHGVPDGLVAALEVATGDDFPEFLVPHPLLDLAPVTEASTEGLPDGTSRWKLPAGFEGEVRVVAASPSQLGIFAEDEAGLAYESSKVRMRSCDQPGTITGDLGDPGTVRALWIASGLESESAITDDGQFSLSVRPGTVLISTYRNTDSIGASPQVLRIKCGEAVNIGTGDTPIDTGPTPGEFLGGLTLDDLFAYSAETTGDLTIGSAGMADCDVSGGQLGVWLDPSDSLEPRLYRLEVDGFDGTGRFEGTFTITDIFSEAASTGTVSVETEVADIDEVDAVGGAFSGTIDGELGKGSFEVSFTCVLFGGLEATAPQPPQGAVNGVEAVWPFGGDPAEPCRNGIAMTQSSGTSEAAYIADAISSDLTARLASSVNRVSWLSRGDVKSILSTEAQQQLLGSDESAVITALSEATNADFLITVSVMQVEGKWAANVRLLQTEPARLLDGIVVGADGLWDLLDEATGNWRKFRRALKSAAICGEADTDTLSTQKGEKTEVSYKVTDLEGEPVDAVVNQISSSCGSFSPNTGQTAAFRGGEPPAAVLPLHVIGGATGRRAEAGTFTTTFTAEVPGCQDEVTFVARAEGPDGELTTKRDAEESTVAITIPMFEFEVTISFDNEHSHLTAQSSGEFFVEPDFDALIGAGTGSIEGDGEARCEVNGVVTWQPFTLVGDYQVMVTGEATERPETDGPWTVKFIPMGFGIETQMTYHTSTDCIEAGTYTNDALGFLGAGALVGFPHWYANQPDGFLAEVRPEGGAIPFEETLIGLPGGSIRGILSDPQP